MDMFCRQCEQTAKGGKCVQHGVCGKSPAVSTLQDLTVQALIGLASYGKMARELGIKDKAADKLIVEGLFTTVTNVNFDEERLSTIIHAIVAARENVKKAFLEEYQRKNKKAFKRKPKLNTFFYRKQ